jgi:hypothetical protein
LLGALVGYEALRFAETRDRVRHEIAGEAVPGGSPESGDEQIREPNCRAMVPPLMRYLLVAGVEGRAGRLSELVRRPRNRRMAVARPGAVECDLVELRHPTDFPPREGGEGTPVDPGGDELGHFPFGEMAAARQKK